MKIYQLFEGRSYCGKEEPELSWLFTSKEALLRWYHIRQGQDFEGRDVCWWSAYADTDDTSLQGFVLRYMWEDPEKLPE